MGERGDKEQDSTYDYYSKELLPLGVEEVPIILKDWVVGTGKGAVKLGTYGGEELYAQVTGKDYDKRYTEMNPYAQTVGYNRDVPVYLDPDVQTAVLTGAFLGAGAMAGAGGIAGETGTVALGVGTKTLTAEQGIKTYEEPTARNIAMFSLMALPETTIRTKK
ncbi:hypothetical protein COU61_04885 [Candidatus Pacearchaeota archaeon CG10_big_fil_rev_8_21_14_0_10_35_13]|nr:MAG: hypothetical protein COU61_04885 [Candidatus Pacearchaeota archaeon CG10_big_fil_rev_8_21_14_0_10_35_13]